MQAGITISKNIKKKSKLVLLLNKATYTVPIKENKINIKPSIARNLFILIKQKPTLPIFHKGC